MAEYIQLDMFEAPLTEADLIWERLVETKISQDKMRKRLFAEFNELREQFVAMKAEHDRLLAALEDRRSIV